MGEATLTTRRPQVAGVVLISGEGMRVAEWVPGRAEDVLVLDFPPLPEGKELRGPAASHPRGSAESGTGARSGRQRDLHDRKVERHRHAFAQAAAKEIGEIVVRRGWQALVVLGDPRFASDIADGAGVAVPVVELGHGAQWLSPTELAAVVHDDLVRVLTEAQVSLVQRIRDEALAGGRGAIGRDDCLTTAAEGRVEALVVDPSLPGAQDLEDAVLEQGGRVELALDGSAALMEELGGACALLRW
ncbi:MAG: hypothetical protein OEV72_09445 [Thermoleophilia bacterium]|nr:hypothetical protein [Thermoleophilia bacterium]